MDYQRKQGLTDGRGRPRAASACAVADGAIASLLRASPLERVGMAAAALAVWSILAMAASLEPEATGLGTHRQLGLDACTFYEQTGYPCPGCGVTTALAAMMRGRVADALAASLFGAALFALLLVGASYLTANAIAGRSCRPLLYSTRTPWLLYGLVLLWLASWGLKSLLTAWAA
jgi:hypothetical protein